MQTTLSKNALDSSSSTKSTTSLKLDKVDFFLIFIGVTILLLGILVALLSFFLLQKTDIENAQFGLQENCQYGLNLLQNAVDDLVKTSYFVNSFVNLLPGSNPNWTNQFLPFVYSGIGGVSVPGNFPKHMTSINIVRIVNATNRNEFIANYRALGGLYSNFSFISKSLNQESISDPIQTVYNIVVEVTPLEGYQNVLGFDFSSDPSRMVAINKALATGILASSQKTIINRLNGSIVGTPWVIPVYADGDTNPITGFTVTVIATETLITSTLGQFMQNLVISVYDVTPDVVNNTEQSFLWTSVQSSSNSSTWTDSQNQILIASAPFYETGYISYADRTLKVIFLPTTAFINEYATSSKWIALSVCLIVMIILLCGCVVSFFLKRLIASGKLHMLQKKRYESLKESTQGLNNMLIRVMRQESQIRATMDAVSDLIVIIADDGRIIHTNARFDLFFQFPQDKFEKGIFIQSLFDNIDNKFYMTLGSTDKIITNMNFEGKNLPVVVTVKKMEEKEPSVKGDEEVEVRVDKDTEAAYIIVIRDLQEISKLVSTTPLSHSN